MKEDNTLKTEVQIDDDMLEDLLAQYRQRLLSCASFTVHRFVTEEDEEWSTALLAFYEAAKNYDGTRGAFWPFASTVVKRRLTDQMRQEYRRASVIPVSPEMWSGEAKENEAEKTNPAEEDVLRQTGKEAFDGTWPGKDTVAEEIKEVSEELEAFGISFFDLTECSPKAQKSREKCARAIAAVFAPPPLLAKMRKSRSFPASEVEKRSGISRKILDKHRKYLIASALILDGDYPLLAEYLEPVRKEIEK